jgi:autoinducer 2-degrading protein
MTISLVVRAVARPASAQQLMAALKEVAEASVKEEPGCLQFDILTDQEDPLKLMLYEVYADEAATKAHQQTPHFQKFLAHGVPLFESHDLKPFQRAAP